MYLFVQLMTDVTWLSSMNS